MWEQAFQYAFENNLKNLAIFHSVSGSYFFIYFYFSWKVLSVNKIQLVSFKISVIQLLSPTFWEQDAVNSACFDFILLK